MHYSSFPSRINVEKTSEHVFNHYHSQETRKAAQEDKDLSAGLDDKQVDDENELGRTI